MGPTYFHIGPHSLLEGLWGNGMERLYELACPIWIIFWVLPANATLQRHSLLRGLGGWAHVRLSKPAISDIAAIFLGILEPYGAYMGPCWAHAMLLKPAISDIAAFFSVFWSHLGPTWDHGGPM